MSRSVEIAVPPKDLEFPPVCANCGCGTTESLDVALVFRRVSEDNPDTFVVEHATVPFCPACLAQHRSEVRTISPSERFWMTWRGREAMGMAGYGVLGLLMLYAFMRRPSLLFLGLASVFGLLVWYSYRVAYRDSERFAVQPPTSVSSAFDFTDVQRRVSDREHRTLVLRNNSFADSLVARNLPRLWTAEDEAKSQTGWRRFFQ